MLSSKEEQERKVEEREAWGRIRGCLGGGADWGCSCRGTGGDLRVGAPESSGLSASLSSS